jgi:hypothetical protein
MELRWRRRNLNPAQATAPAKFSRPRSWEPRAGTGQGAADLADLSDYPAARPHANGSRQIVRRETAASVIADAQPVRQFFDERLIDFLTAAGTGRADYGAGDTQGTWRVIGRRAQLTFRRFVAATLVSDSCRLLNRGPP